jgi:hypothetical protein
MINLSCVPEKQQWPRPALGGNSLESFQDERCMITFTPLRAQAPVA